MYKNLNIEHLGCSKHKILVHEFDLFHSDPVLIITHELIAKIITELHSFFIMKHFLVFYFTKDKEWIQTDLVKYNLIDLDDDLFATENSIINMKNSVYFVKKNTEEYGIEALSKLIYDRIELKIGETIFIQLLADLIIYPHDDCGFGIIDLGKNQSSIDKVKKVLNCYGAIYSVAGGKN